MGLLEETPQNNFKVVQNYIKRQRSKRSIAVYEIVNIKVRRRVPKCKQFTKTIEEMPDDIFYSHFRMGISTFKVSHTPVFVLQYKKITVSRNCTGCYNPYGRLQQRVVQPLL